MGLAERWLPTPVRARLPGWSTVDSALVRGSDSFGHFHTEQHARADLSEAAIAHPAEVTERPCAFSAEPRAL